MKSLPIPLPPLAEQHALLNAVIASFARAASIREITDTLGADLTPLDQSILAKAFRGELVPQDPSDEPASELLARIRSTHTSQAAPRMDRKSSRSQTKKRAAKG